MVYIQLERRALLALCYWSVGTIMALGGNGFGSTGAHSYISTNFSTAFRLRNCLFFFFLLFFLCQFLSYFYFFFVSFHGIFRRIFASLPSLTHSPTPPPHPSAPNKKERPFCFAPDHSFDYSALLAYAKRTGCFVVWKTLHWLTF